MEVEGLLVLSVLVHALCRQTCYTHINSHIYIEVESGFQQLPHKSSLPEYGCLVTKLKNQGVKQTSGTE